MSSRKYSKYYFQLDDTAPSTKRKRLDKKNQSEESTLLSFSPSNIAAAEDPTDTELDKLYETISKTEDKQPQCSVHTLIRFISSTVCLSIIPCAIARM